MVIIPATHPVVPTGWILTMFATARSTLEVCSLLLTLAIVESATSGIHPGLQPYLDLGVVPGPSKSWLILQWIAMGFLFDVPDSESAETYPSLNRHH